MNRRPTVLRVTVALFLVIAAAAAITGCGVGAGPGTRDASVLVTGDFGADQIGSASEAKVPGAETVMSLLDRHFRVSTRYGGGFVESIDGRAGNARRTDWFYFVNGIQAGAGAAATSVHAGDHIWWDLHNWTATDSIPAVVGAFPEPFKDGLDGRRPATVRLCAADMRAGCDLVAESLRRIGVTAAQRDLTAGGRGAGPGSRAEPGSGAELGSDAMTVVVGTWSQIQGLSGAKGLGAGPAQSGVYAQFIGGEARGGGGHGAGAPRLSLDGPLGTAAETLRGSVGLIAATQSGSSRWPTWFVTGTDPAGVMAAARAFTAAKLDDHFALAVQGTRVIPLPVDPSGAEPTRAGGAG